MCFILRNISVNIYDTFVTGIRTISTSALMFWNIIQNDSAEINVSKIYLFSRVTVFRYYWLQESAKSATCVCKKKLCLVVHGMALPSSAPWRLRKSHPDCIFIGPFLGWNSLRWHIGRRVSWLRRSWEGVAKGPLSKLCLIHLLSSKTVFGRRW